MCDSNVNTISFHSFIVWFYIWAHNTSALVTVECAIELAGFGVALTHKTSWARSLGPHDYFKNEIDIDNLDSRSLYRVFDDLKDFKKFDYKSWIGCDTFSISRKYRKEKTVEPLPVIYIANQLLSHKLIKDFDWWIANTFRYHVDRHLPPVIW